MQQNSNGMNCCCHSIIAVHSTTTTTCSLTFNALPGLKVSKSLLGCASKLVTKAHKLSQQYDPCPPPPPTCTTDLSHRNSSPRSPPGHHHNRGRKSDHTAVAACCVALFQSAFLKSPIRVFSKAPSTSAALSRSQNWPTWPNKQQQQQCPQP